MVSSLFTRVVAALSTVGIDRIPVQHDSGSWPHAPLYTEGRNILNQKGEEVVYAGANWPGHLDCMIPEGLQYQSISTIVGRLKQLSMNVIRFTYAIEMIDDIFENSPDQTLNNTLVKCLGVENGTRILGQILENNPQLNENTTRLEVFDAVAEECYKQEIYVHLDNQISHAGWCCLPYDGNGWFGDSWFDTYNWTRGLTYMSAHAGANWKAFTSMDLRNELRNPQPGRPDSDQYNWFTWDNNMLWASNCINYYNPNPLIFYGGLGYDEGITQLTDEEDLGDGRVFNVSAIPYSDKVIFELHNYVNAYNGTCPPFEESLYSLGFNAMDNSTNTTAKNIAPVVLSEFGFTQDNVTYTYGYARCLKEYLEQIQGSWMVWVLSGSYYIKLGVQDPDEGYGLLNHDWSAWRSEVTIDNYFIPFAKNVTAGTAPA